MKANKKVYNFTDRQRRRDRSTNIFTIGKYSKWMAKRKFRRDTKKALRLAMLDDDSYIFPYYKQYLWWDD